MYGGLGERWHASFCLWDFKCIGWLEENMRHLKLPTVDVARELLFRIKLGTLVKRNIQESLLRPITKHH